MKQQSPADEKTRKRRKRVAVRMKDIALDMGLSTVTISKALRGHQWDSAGQYHALQRGLATA